MVSLVNELRSEWLRVAQSVVRKRGRQLSDLRFAKRTKHGYAFFVNRDTPWDLLHEITQAVAALYPDYDYALVAESCSELVNTEDLQ